MAREKEGYRENLEQINARYPDKESLNYTEISELFGYSYRTALRRWKKVYNKTVGGVPKTTIARTMCG